MFYSHVKPEKEGRKKTTGKEKYQTLFSLFFQTELGDPAGWSASVAFRSSRSLRVEHTRLQDLCRRRFCVYWMVATLDFFSHMLKRI